MRRYLAGLLLALSLSPAISQTCGYQYRITLSSTIDSGWQPSAEAAANIVAGLLTNNGSCTVGGPYIGGVTFTPGAYNSTAQTVAYTRVAKNWAANCQSQTESSPTYGNWNVALQPKECVPIPRTCPVENGGQYSFNRTEGWSTSAEPGTPIMFGETPTGTTYDTGICLIDISGGLQSESCYRSQVPASNGLYRVSCDYTGTVVGDTAGVTNDSTNPTAPPPACPGQQGEVNGVPVCIGTTENPLPPGTEPPSAGANTNGTGNPPAGTVEDGQSTTGGGESRTPATGSGTASGGPAAAYNPNGGGTGNTDSDGTDEQGEPCGGPGQPVCRVKVDESGTPNGQGAFNGLNQQADSAAQSIESTVTGLINNVIPSWSWTFQLPTGCTAFVLDAFDMALDMCEYQPLIHDLMSMVWIAATISFLVALFIRTD